MKWLDDTRRSLGERWGESPTRIEPVSGTLLLRNIGKAKEVLLKPLDNRGQSTIEATQFTSKDDGWQIVLPEKPATLWYLVEVGNRSN
jgi:hypothetical protein